MLNLVLMLLMVTPATASDMELITFEEICEITGELKASASVVEPVELRNTEN